MAVRHFPKRNIQWYVNYRHPYLLDDKGKPKRIYEPFDNEPDARKRDAHVKYQLKYEREVFLPDDYEEESNDDILRVDDVLLLYLKDVAARKKNRKFAKKNMETNLSHLKYVRPIIGDIPVVELCKADMREVVIELRKSRIIDQAYFDKNGRHTKTIKRKFNGCSQCTINRKVGMVKSALNWAEDQELIEENPIRRFKAPRGPNNKPSAPTPEEINRILKAAIDHVRRVVVIGVGTGCRVGPSELFDLRWSHVSQDCTKIRIYSADKNPNIPHRDIDLKPAVTVALRVWREIDMTNGLTEHIIHWRGKPIDSIKKAWGSTLKRADIGRRIRPYDCRHHYISQALRKKCDLKAISIIVGHADPTMILRHYQEVVAESLQEVMNSVTDLDIPEIGTEPQDLRKEVE